MTCAPPLVARLEREQWLAQLDKNEKAVRWDLPDLSKFMMATVVRVGEALGVHWEDVDLKAATVEVAHTVVRIRGQGLYRKPKPKPKTKASEQVLPLPSWAVELLGKRKVEAEADGRPADSPVFASSASGLRDPSNLLRVIRQTRGGEEFLWVTWHTFRKTTATALDDADVSTRLIADQLGHSRVSMTQDVYMARKTGQSGRRAGVGEPAG